MKVLVSWIQEYIEETLPAPNELSETLGLRAFEVEGVERKGEYDAVLDVDILPNRAHDCLSHRGIARETAALYGYIFSERVHEDISRETASLDVRVEESELCDRYMGTIVRNIKVGPSPDWLKERLEALGERSINNVVDVTNYVMFDLGQPLHAFDRKKLSGDAIVVRRAADGESMTTLDGEEVELDNSRLVIADEDSVLALAGVKGGKKAEVDEDTTDIVLEAAHFDPTATRRSARELSILTEASKRFENALSSELAEKATQRAIELLLEVSGTEDTAVEESVDVYTEPPSSWSVNVPFSSIESILGISVPKNEAVAILERLQCTVEEKEDSLTVTPPMDRKDLLLPEDIVEEIGRIHGYENLSHVLPSPLEESAPINKEFYYQAVLHSTLQNCGFSEIYTYSIREKGAVELANPLTHDRRFLRNELSSDMRAALDFNERYSDLVGITRVDLFEIANIFTDESEALHLALGVRTTQKKQKPASREVIEETLARLSEVLGVDCSKYGDHSDDGVWEGDMSAMFADLSQPEGWDITFPDPEVSYTAISPYPYVLRDIAVFTPGGTASSEVLSVIKETAGPLLVNHRLFDVYEKNDDEGNAWVSYAFRIVFQSYEKTLSDEEVNRVMDAVTETLNSKDGWTVR